MAILNNDILKHITKVPIEKATKPFDGAIVIANRYWIVIDDCILFYRKHSPQCNSQLAVVESIKKRLYPDAEIRFLECVYREHNCYEVN